MKLMQYIKVLLFGERAQGQLVLPPTLKTLTPSDKLTEDEWVNHVKFGSRYGYKGSFFNYNQDYEKNRLYQISQQKTCAKHCLQSD